MIGSRVSHFRILGRLGGEGAGVYRAEDLSAGGPVLLHFLAPETTSAEAVERFRKAALDAASLGHPNIAAVREIGTAEDGRLYLSLPAADGQTLESLLARGPMPPRSAIDLAAQIAAGVARAHAAGIVHGDLRPSCILVTTWSEVKVTAFGLGELAVPQSRGEPGEEGAAAYRAPEVLQGGPGGMAADVWSLGVMLYEMIAGRHPFAGALAGSLSGATNGDRELAAAIAGGEPEPLPVPRGGLPRGLERTITRSLARRPEDRYPDARPLELALLHAFAAGATPDLTATRAEMPAAPGSNPPGVPLRGTPLGVGAGAGGAGAGPTPTPRGLAGRKLQSYRIFEQLGSGAMSVVYRAEDSRLERSVALKFLAPELSRDPQAKARFLREARAASSLDHPNICTIHEIEETDDHQIFIAMPYYGGETLAQRIARGPLPLDEALDIALQVAQGLAKAHRHGIVHRDIKPANLMLTPDGVVKIVDFGLAKLADASGSRTGPRTGSAGGTVAYVSPEQARGEAVDAGTDLWSLGVVLYEMAAGCRPFQGDNEQAVLYAVLRDEPRPLPELRPDAPPELARIVRRLLTKDCAARYAAAEGVAADLRALRGPETLGSRSVVTFPPGTRLRTPFWRRPTVLGAAAAVAALLLLLVAWGFWRQSASVEAPVTASYAVVADQPGRETFPSLAPDGEALVYALEREGTSDIYWQRAGGGSNAINLTADNPGIDTQPALSPDGKRIAFRSDRDGGGLFLMGQTGESVRRIAESGYNPAWSPDGREIVYASEAVASPGGRGAVSGLWRTGVDVNPANDGTGAPRPVPTGGDAVQPSWSPHNLRIAYWGIPAGTSRRVIWTVSVDGVDGGTPVPVVDDGFLNWSPAWSPDGTFLYFASDRSGSMSLWRVPIDESSGAVRGRPQAIPAPVSSGVLPSLASDGRHIAFAGGSRTANLFVAPFDPVQRQISGTLEQVTRGTRVVRSGELSPDGSALVFDTAEPQEDLFVARPDGSGLRPLTNDPAKDRDPRWSPDSRRVLFYSDRSGRWEAWIASVADGSLEPVAAGVSEAVFDPLWSPDGHSLVYSRGGHGSVDVVLLDLRQPPASRRPRPLPVSGQPPARFAVTSWSRDGNWLAGFDDQGRIVLYSFPAQRYEVLEEHGEEVCWLRDGRSLLFLRRGALWLFDRPTGEVRKLLDPPNGFLFSRLSAGPGDRVLTLVEEPSEGFIGMLTLR